MDEEMKGVSTMLAENEILVKAYKTFLDATDRVRYYGYVDKKELKKLCRKFNYTDTRSFVKGGITAAVVIGAIKLYRNRKDKKLAEEKVEETIE